MHILQRPLQPVLQQAMQRSLNGVGEGGSTPAFSPASLFAGGEQGVWLDESDLSSMFQSPVSGGVLLIPVTAADQPVAARMDKHIDVGWVVVGNAVWAKTQGDGVLSVVGNVVTVTGATTVTHITRIAGSIPAVPGSARMSIVANYAGATGVQFWLRGAPRALTNNVPVTVVSGLTNSSLERLDVSSGTVSFTINELSYWRGNHWTAPNNSSRPILRLTGGLYSLEWDGVDDQQLMPAGAWTLVTCYFAGYLDNAHGVQVWNPADPSKVYFGVYESGNDHAPNKQTGVGSPTYKVDGTALSPVTRGRLYTLMFNQSTILETQTLTLPTSGGLSIAGYSGFQFKGFSSGEVMRNSNLTSDEAAQLRTWLAAKQGRVL